jgi:LemA protein
MKKLLNVAAILFILSTFTGCGYNTIIKNDEAVKEAWGNVQSAYQRRLDLIPNLVEVVKGYAKHEKETLQAVIEARSKASSIQVTPELMSNPKAFQNFQNAQGSINSALSRLMVVVEKYPDLKANQQFTDLQHQLEGTENRINVARNRYNESVKIFNTSIRTFPYNITNSIFNKLTVKEAFSAQAGAETAPTVKF